MAVHFGPEEFEARRERMAARMAERKLDAMLLFAQESMYWLTGYDTFGFCFFQCMIATRDGRTVLVTRSADLRQARATSTVADVRVWVDRGEADPIAPLKEILFELGLLGYRLGIETDTHGLTALNGRLLAEGLQSFATLVEASDLVPALRAVKSPAELDFARTAARIADDAFLAARAAIGPGVNEGRVLAALQGAIFEAGGDYAGNDFILGSGPDALLCRHRSGRRVIGADDQVTLEFAGTWRHYHAALMRTVVVGAPKRRHVELFAAARDALAAVEAEMRPGKSFGDVFDAHARVVDGRGMQALRLNACGYSLGARFAPSWMDAPMFYRGNKAEIVPDMVLFAHMILFDDESGTAMTLGRTYITTAGDPESLSTLPLELEVVR